LARRAARSSGVGNGIILAIQIVCRYLLPAHSNRLKIVKAKLIVVAVCGRRCTVVHMQSLTTGFFHIERSEILEILKADSRPCSALAVAVLVAESHTQQQCPAGRPVEWALSWGCDTRQVRQHLKALAEEGLIAAVDPLTASQVAGVSGDPGPFYVPLI
jgi:hypothetical protein